MPGSRNVGPGGPSGPGAAAGDIDVIIYIIYCDTTRYDRVTPLAAPDTGGRALQLNNAGLVTLSKRQAYVHM